ncbi:hypothetical protein [Flavobacterium johnsoniae]|uniref:Uncharacterized protein n=1 Tax=Flavobacterium johnsoniae TaxID=986 RepID=A0A1J7BYL2_FLAJO|nr:hypothetical protein [Flavobacterium johnsoniae]OIV43742.1 hypothetical protein BKM63_00610 [Flavobacterium johnsoniae]
MKNIDKVQNLLPLGYLFLIILGITKDSIFYYQIGINIIKYSSIMDILISPIAAVTSHPVFFITILLLFIFYYNLPKILLKNEDKKWIHKFSGITKTDTELKQLSEEEKLNCYTTASIKSLSTFLISLFLGYGIADGKFLSEHIKSHKLHYNYKLNYSDEKSENVYIIGSNTAYYFYMSEGNSAIKIAPVGSIKNLELIKNRMLDK